MRPSRQRALIALRSFPSLVAAARSLRTTKSTLLNMTIGDPELRKAYVECRDGVIRARQAEERAAENRQREDAKPRVTVRQAEKNKARLFAAVGADPRFAVGALHKRLNRERRQKQAADLEAALDSLSEIQSQAGSLKPITKQVLDVWDRWCANCKAHRVDDPCEVCCRHTVLVKGDGGPTSRGEP